MAEAYADVYFRAWKAAVGPFLHTIEYKCVQDIMYHAVHAPRQGFGAKQSILASNLRAILGQFHAQKRQVRVSVISLVAPCG